MPHSLIFKFNIKTFKVDNNGKATETQGKSGYFAVYEGDDPFDKENCVGIVGFEWNAGLFGGSYGDIGFNLDTNKYYHWLPLATADDAPLYGSSLFPKKVLNANSELVYDNVFYVEKEDGRLDVNLYEYEGQNIKLNIKINNAVKYWRVGTHKDPIPTLKDDAPTSCRFRILGAFNGTNLNTKGFEKEYACLWKQGDYNGTLDIGDDGYSIVATTSMDIDPTLKYRIRIDADKYMPLIADCYLKNGDTFDLEPMPARTTVTFKDEEGNALDLNNIAGVIKTGDARNCYVTFTKEGADNKYGLFDVNNKIYIDQNPISVSLMPGEYKYTARIADYGIESGHIKSGTVTVSHSNLDMNDSVNQKMSPVGIKLINPVVKSIMVQVTDKDNMPVKGAIVTVDGKMIAAATDEDGWIDVNGYRQGKHDFKVFMDRSAYESHKSVAYLNDHYVDAANNTVKLVIGETYVPKTYSVTLSARTGGSLADSACYQADLILDGGEKTYFDTNGKRTLELTEGKHTIYIKYMDYEHTETFNVTSSDTSFTFIVDAPHYYWLNFINLDDGNNILSGLEYVFDKGTKNEQKVTSDKEGWVKVRLLEGEHDLEVTVFGTLYPHHFSLNETKNSSATFPRPAETVKPVTENMCTLHLKAQVLDDDETLTGQPIQNLPIYLDGDYIGFTDKKGDFTKTVPVGAHIIAADVYGERFVKEITLVNGVNEFTFRLNWSKLNTSEALFEYSDNVDGTVTITSYTGADDTVVLPQTIDGKAVAVIGNRAFKGNTTIKAVYIPEGVRSAPFSTFGNGAFTGCTSLKTVYIPSTLTSASYMFSGCSSLDGSELYFADGLTTIPEHMFDKCSGLKTVVMPDTVTSIDET